MFVKTVDSILRPVYRAIDQLGVAAEQQQAKGAELTEYAAQIQFEADTAANEAYRAIKLRNKLIDLVEVSDHEHGEEA